jgi:glycosyltransferase domain-containing protein
MILKKISILILTNSLRSDFIKRCLQYHHNIGCKIIIIDSSKKKLIVNKPHIKVFQNCDEDLYNRLNYGLSKVRTSHVLWLGDDDFLIKKTLRKCDKILKKNSYNMIQGQYVKFTEKNFSLKDYNSDFFFYNLKHFKKYQNKEYALGNFYHSFKMFNPHAILNKKIFKKAINFFISNPNYKPYAYFDIIISIFFFIESKSYLIKDLYQLRSYGTGLWQNKNNIVKNKKNFFYSTDINSLYNKLKINNFMKSLVQKETNVLTWNNFLDNIIKLSLEQKDNHKNQTFVGNFIKNLKEKIIGIDYSKIYNYQKNLQQVEFIKEIIIKKSDKID